MVPAVEVISASSEAGEGAEEGVAVTEVGGVRVRGAEVGGAVSATIACVVGSLMVGTVTSLVKKLSPPKFPQRSVPASASATLLHVQLITRQHMAPTVLWESLHIPLDVQGTTSSFFQSPVS